MEACGGETHAHLRAVGEGIRHTVDGELVVISASAVSGELRRRVVEGCLAKAHVGSVDGPRSHEFEFHGVAGEQRQFEHPPLVDHLAERCIGSGQQRRIRFHFDLFGDVAYGHLDVDFHPVTHPDLDVFTEGIS